MSLVRNGQTLLTYSDYARIPEDGRRHEIIGGVHHVTPSPNRKHQRVSRWIFAQLFDQIERRRLGEVVYARMDVVLSPIDVVQPDILVVLDDMRKIANPKNVQGAPNLVVEITSPSSRKRDLEVKRSLYASKGVPEYWIVHTNRNVVEKLVLGKRGYRRRGTYRKQIEFSGLPNVVVDLGQVWSVRSR
ncbi:MAG: Uma2 family endonuclease [Planctomycetes bacterium]|nr:Uma2 family endonuclease [Planctomycetota bacterium]MBI3844724.1 Uma2 family endonuclease [Planctomycetota bacterium]